MAKRVRVIVGYNLHPVVGWEDAARNLVNAMTALDGLFEKTADGDAHVLREELSAVMVRLSAKRAWYAEHLRGLPAEVVNDARDGLVPWPDVEDPDGFVPRCSCHDRCLHERGLDPGPIGVCNCGRVCLAHGGGA